MGVHESKSPVQGILISQEQEHGSSPALWVAGWWAAASDKCEHGDGFPTIAAAGTHVSALFAAEDHRSVLS